jgi:hypothetical protein
MNKIINELFNRAGGRTEVCDVTGDEILTYNEYLDPEKFAELIIRECANVVAEHYDPSEPWITPKTLLYHFGVEL